MIGFMPPEKTRKVSNLVFDTIMCLAFGNTIDKHHSPISTLLDLASKLKREQYSDADLSEHEQAYSTWLTSIRKANFDTAKGISVSMIRICIQY